MTQSIKPEVRNISPRRQMSTDYWATAIDSTHKKFDADRMCSSQHRHNRHVHSLQYSAPLYQGRSKQETDIKNRHGSEETRLL